MDEILWMPTYVLTREEGEIRAAKKPPDDS